MKRTPRRLDSGDNEPLALLHFGFRAVVNEADAELGQRGLGRVHHRILFFIARSPSLTPGELLATLGISKQALHGPLQVLVGMKLVTRQIDPDNRRQFRLTLTAAGRALEDRLSGSQRSLFQGAFRAAGPHAARGWHAVMRALGATLLVNSPAARQFARASRQRAAACEDGSTSSSKIVR